MLTVDYRYTELQIANYSTIQFSVSFARAAPALAKNQLLEHTPVK